MLTKKSKILLSAFSILTFAMAMPTSNVLAEDTVPDGSQLPHVTLKGDKAYAVSIPHYLSNNKNTKKESNENFDIYISQLNYNSEYGVVVVGLQAKKNIDSATFSLMVENGEVADSISKTATPDANWYYRDLIDSMTGGTLENAPVSFGQMNGVYAGEYVQFGVYYKLKNEDKIKINYSFDGNTDTILKAEKENNVNLENILGSTKGTSVENLKTNKKVDFMNFDELNKYIEEKTKKSEDAAKENNQSYGLDKKYSSKKSEAKVETKTKYPWLLPSAIGGSVIILFIAGLLGRRYIKK